MTNEHVSVMRTEALEALNVSPGRWYIDATFGRGGHTEAILENQGNVVAFDWDREAIDAGKVVFENEIAAERLHLIRETFAEIDSNIKDLQQNGAIGQIHGILFDFGTSTNQLMSEERGFSFSGNGNLDMRMDDRLGVQAKDILAAVPESQLADLFFHTGGELDARKIAKAIKSSPSPITTTQQLAAIVEKVKRGRSGNLHPATKVFQALRIAVNSELEQIETALPQAMELLSPEGTIVTIAFHEGEDRLAKTKFKDWAKAGLGTETGPISPTKEEIDDNPRARSAKLRVFRKN